MGTKKDNAGVAGSFSVKVEVPYKDTAQAMEDAAGAAMFSGEKLDALSDCGVDAAHGKTPCSGPAFCIE